MFLFFKNHTYPIGLDMGEDGLRLLQLKRQGDSINLIAGAAKRKPQNVQTASGGWQRWAIKSICDHLGNGSFRGRQVIAAMPAGEVFIDHIISPKSKGEKLQKLIYSKMKKKLGLDFDNMVLKYISCEENNLLVMAAERQKVERYLAVFEQADLQIKSIEVWPVALANCYANFFARRQTDLKTVVMLLDFTFGFANVAICRAKNVLFARSIPVDSDKPDAGGIRGLILELNGCRRRFSSLYRKARIERLIFLTPAAIDKQTCATIAEKLQLPAQIGNCLQAVKVADPDKLVIERRDFSLTPQSRNPKKRMQNSWAVALGLSLGVER